MRRVGGFTLKKQVSRGDIYMLQDTPHPPQRLANGDLSHKGRGTEVLFKFYNMSFKKLALLSFLALPLVGCGFQPLMSGQHDTPQRFNLKISGTGYCAYKFRRELEKQLALTPKINDKAYVLKIVVSEGYVPIAYGADATVSRSQIQATATYIIQDGNQFIAKGTVTAYSTYILNYTEEFSTRSAQAAASERTLLSLSEELAREVMLKIRSAPEKEVKEIPQTEEDKDNNW